MQINDILGRLKGVTGSGHKYSALCPAHDDHNPSLGVVEFPNYIHLNCFAGCSTDKVLDALGLDYKDLNKDYTPYTNNGNKWVKDFYYYDEQGNYYYHIKKGYKPDGEKTFRKCRFDTTGVEIWNHKGITPIPYNLPQLLKAIRSDEVIYLVEGEKDVDNLVSIGCTATTTGGSTTWNTNLKKWFKNAKVIIIPDNDTPGREYANNAYKDLLTVAKYVQIIELPLEKEGEDVSDWLEKYHDMKKAKKDLQSYIDEKWDKKAEEEFKNNIADSISDLIELSNNIKKLALSDIEFVKPIIYFQDLPAVYPNSFTVIQGQKGTYKSNVAQNIASAALTNSSVGGFYKNAYDKKEYFVIYIDTERSVKDAFPFAVQSMIKRAELFEGFPETKFPDESFLPISFMPFERKERLGKLESLLKFYTTEMPDKKILVIVDIYPDLMANFNDNIETDKIIDSALHMINNYDCSIVFTIHENYGTAKAVGHAGSSAVRKASVHIQLQTDKDGILGLKFLNVRHHKKQTTEYKLVYDQDKFGLELLEEEEVQSKIEERKDYVISLLSNLRQKKADIAKKVAGRFQITDKQATRLIDDMSGTILDTNQEITIEKVTPRRYDIFLKDISNV